MVRGGGGLDTLRFDELTHGVEVDLASGVVIAQGRDSVASIHFVWGTDHADVIRAGTAPLDVRALDGDDLLIGGPRGDLLYGGPGADVIEGGGGDDYLEGWSGNDTLRGGVGDDGIEPGEGVDIVDGGPGIDMVGYGYSLKRGVTVDLSTGVATGQGRDELTDISDVQGSRFADVIIGDAADNYLRGLSGDDVLRGAAGNDTLVGEEGDDRLNGGAGTDSLDGGEDNDVCTRGETYESCEVILE